MDKICYSQGEYVNAWMSSFFHAHPHSDPLGCIVCFFFFGSVIILKDLEGEQELTLKGWHLSCTDQVVETISCIT